MSELMEKYRRKQALKSIQVRARSTDPATSHLAALKHQPRAGSQRARILDAIADAGSRGMTAAEAGRATGINGAWKRVSELAQGGHITEAGIRVDPESGANGTVYIVP